MQLFLDEVLENGCSSQEVILKQLMPLHMEQFALFMRLDDVAKLGDSTPTPSKIQQYEIA